MDRSSRATSQRRLRVIWDVPLGVATMQALLLSATAHAAPLRAAPTSTEAKCRGYLGRTIEGATITKAELVLAKNGVAETCVLLGEMPHDLDFEVRMPTRWNQRTIFIGGGGFDGEIRQEIVSAPATDPSKGSYATIATNHGHNADMGDSTLPPVHNAAFALDVQMFSDYAYLSVPRVLAPAKQILRAFYGQRFDAGKLVFEGCSGGGRRALLQAQRYPNLFDGIIARAPANAFVPQFLWYAKLMKLRAKPGGDLTPGLADRIGALVRGRCDDLDGLKDGIISRPEKCKFDPAEIACEPGEIGGTCLTPPQLATVRAYYEPTSVANGRFAWPGFLPGGEMDFAWGLDSSGSHNRLFNGFARFMVAQDPNRDPLTVDFEKEVPRLAYLSAALDAVDPDLSRFSARGGKLLLWTGMSDWVITANNATAYYQSVVEKAGGQAAADEFVEYYTSPDVQHCRRGAGPDQIDLATPMFEWLEKGVKPSSSTIVAIQSNVPQGAEPVSRPLCRFPRYPKYIGGDPSIAASFTCAMPTG